MIRKILVTVVFLLVVSPLFSLAGAADFTSIATGNWNSATTWIFTGVDADGIPDADDTVTVAVGHTVTIGTAAAAATSLTVNGTLTMNNTLAVSGATIINGTLAITGTTGTKTFTGLVTLNSGAAWNNSGNENVSFNGGLASGGTFTGGSGTNAVTGNLTVSGSTFTTSGTTTVSSTVAINGGTATFAGATTLSNTLTVASGAVLNTSNTLSVTGATNDSGTLNVTSTTGTKTFTGLVTLNSGGIWNNSANEAVAFNGGLASGGTFTGGSGTNTVTGTLTVSAGTFGTTGTASVSQAASINGGTATFAGSTTFSNTLTVASGAVLNTSNTVSVSGATNISGTLNITSTTGTKTFIGTVTINNGAVWSNSASEAVTFRGGLINNGTFTSGTGTHTFDTNSQALSAASGITFSGAVAITGAITVTNNTTVTIAGALTGSAAGSTWLNAADTTLNIAGTPMATGTLNASAAGNTVNYNGAAQTVKASTYHHLTLAGSGTKTMPAGAITVNGTFTKSGTSSATAAAAMAFIGDVVISGGTFTSGSFTHTFDGNWTNNGGTFTPSSGTITFNSTTADQAINGTAATQTFYNITVAKTARTLSVGGSTATVALNNNLTLTSGIFDAGTAATISIAGNWTNNAGTGAFIARSSTVVFTVPAGSRTLTGSSSFYGLTFNAGGSRTFTIASGTTLTVTGLLTLTDGYVNTGALDAQGDISVASTFDGTNSAPPGSLTISGGNNQILTGGGSATAGDFLQLTINKSGGTLTLAGILRTGRNWTYTAGTVDAASSTVVFSLRTLTVTGSMTFNNVTFNTATTYTIASGTTLTTTGILALTDGYVNTGALNAQGNITVAATFDGTNSSPLGSLTISGSNNQTLTGGGSATAGDFLPLTINKSGGTLTLAGILRTGRNWTYTAGTVNPGSSTVAFSLRALTITGSLAFYNLTFNTNAVAFTVAAGTTLTTTGTLSLTDGYLNAGAITAQGNVTLASTFDGSSGTPTNLTISGTANQTLTGGGSATAGDFLPVTINKTGGTLTLASIIRSGRNWTYTAGTVDPGSSTVVFSLRALTITGSMTFYNLTFNTATTFTIPAATTLTVNGVLDLTDGTVNTGTINAKGNITIAATSDNGSAKVNMNGADDQTMSCSGAAPGGQIVNTLTINKTGVGRAIITGNVRLHQVNLVAGTLNFSGGYTYTFHTADALIASSGTTLNFNGSSGNLVTLRSSTTGTRWTLTVNASASYSAVYADARDSNASAGRLIVAITSVNSGNNLNWKFPSGLVFTTAQQSIVQNVASGVITVQVQDGSGSAVNVNSNTRIDLTTTSATGLFSSNALFGDNITYVTIPNGSSSAGFYYKDSTAGVYTITAAEFPSQSWTDATQSIYVGNKGEWGYKREITLTSASAQTNFQVLLTLDTSSLVSAGKMNSDGSDIRFYDSDDITGLSYWIESGMNTASTRIWVKIPSLTTPTKKIYLYYGKSDAVSFSSGSGTFDFFDDFDSLATTIWTKTNTSTISPTTVSGSRLIIPQGSVYTNNTVVSSQNEIVEAKARWTNTTGGYSGLMTSNSQSTSGRNASSKALVYYMRDNPAGNMNVNYWAANGTTASYNLGSGVLFAAVTNTEYIMGCVTTSSNTVLYYRDYTLIRTLAGTWNYPFYLWMGYFTGSSAGNTDIKDISVDWIRVRKYAAAVPVSSVGTETKNIAKLNFTTSAQTNLIEGKASNIMTVQTQDRDGGAATVSVDTTITVSSSSGGGSFSASASGPWTETLDVTILAGQSSADFYYLDTEVGTPTITAAESPDVGWTDVEQVEKVNPAVNTFDVSAASPQVAGQPFTLTIKAIDEEGEVSPTYTDPVNITVNYITPSAGAGTLAVTTTSSFSNGIASITNQSFSDCGTITITVTKADDAAKTGTSNNIVVIPNDFTVTVNETEQTVNKPFVLTVTARNAQGSFTPNYKGNASVSAVYISPASDQGGTISPAVLGSVDFSNGTASVAGAKYDKWGMVKIKVSDALDGSRTGESEEIMFLPKDFSVVPSTPPSARDFYYLKEELGVMVTARDQDNNTVANYQGGVLLSSSDNSVATDYTFVPVDMGAHQFTLSFTEPGRKQISCQDTAYSRISGISDAFEAKEGKIRILSTSGNVGKLEVRAEIVDAQDRLITQDNSTSFTVSLVESAPDNSAVCEAKTVPVTVSEGRAVFQIEDNAPERVTVTPLSDPELTPVPGDVVFGSFSGRGMGIDTWREIK